MAIPELIPIAYMPNSYTRYIGKYGDGKQFMAFVTATLANGARRGRRERKRWYAVLHRFDSGGNHLGTDAWFAGVEADGWKIVEEKAKAKRLEMLAGLGKYALCDIRVKLFRTDIEGQLCGLIDDSSEEAGFEDRVVLWPNDFLFHAPWDGTYDT